MAFFNKDWNTKVTVDASPVGLGAVLSQHNPLDKNERHIVCFASRLLSDVERRYRQCKKDANKMQMQINKMRALQDFIRVYNETPHSATKVSPAMLMLGFSRTSDIPQASNVPNMKLLSYLYKRAVENYRRSKLRMQAEYDSRMRAKECTIAVGCKVLIKQERVNKSTSPLDPKPFPVMNVNGSMITAARHAKVSSSFFKPYRTEEEEQEELVRLQILLS